MSEKVQQTETGNALQRFLQLFAGILWHAFEFALQILTDQLMERAAENIALPELLRVALVLSEQVFDELIRLLLVTHDRAKLGLDIRPHEVNGGCAGAQTHGVAASLADDLRLIQMQL